MTKTIYITRRTISEIISGGLSRVDVWFTEPCLNVKIGFNKELCPFDDDTEYDIIHEKLKGVLFSDNSIHNFIYRTNNQPINHNGEFGDKLIVNSTGEDFPQILIDLYNERKLNFKHGVFGSGNKVNYRPNNVANLFGYDSEISKHIWRLVYQDIDPQNLYTSLNDWDNIKEEDNPWWRFCKKIDIEINLKY